MREPAQVLLEVVDLHAAYATARVLHGVSLEIGDGEVVGLLGRNGMGKTTLLRVLAGLRPPTVLQGSIRLAGNELRGLRSHQIARRGVSLVPQGRRIFGSLSVEENLDVVWRHRGARWDIARVFELFPRLADRRRQSAGTLSGGEQQMLAIGRSLMTGPTLLVMDEPTEGLAPSIREVIIDRLRALQDERPAVLLAEQNVDVALAVADRVAVLGESGTIEWSGTAEALRRDGSVMRALIGL